MEIIGKILNCSTINGVSSLTLREETNNNEWNYTNLCMVKPISLTINKTGQIVRIFHGTSDSNDKEEFEIQIDITSQPGLVDDFNAPEYRGLRIRVVNLVNIDKNDKNNAAI